MEEAPDLTLVGNGGFNLKAAIKSGKLYDKGIFTGKHTQHDAFLLVSDSSGAYAIPDNPSVFDVVDIVDKLKSKRKPEI